MPVEGLLLCASEPSQPSRLPSSFWLLHCAKCSSALLLSAQESPRPGQGTRPPRASSGSLLTPGTPLGWITLFLEQTGLIQSFRPDPDLQDPGQPSRPLHRKLPALPPLHLPHCAGGRGCVFNKAPGPLPGPPPGKGAFGQPRDLAVVCHLGLPTHCPP